MFQVPSHIKTIRTLVDGGLSLTVETQELGSSEATKVFELRMKPGYFVFKEGEIKQEDLIDVPEVATEYKSDRTPGQRLRGVIYRYHEKLTKEKKTDKDFDSFYKGQMEALIGQYKDRLN